VAQYAGTGAQVVVLGRLEGSSALVYRGYDTWSGTRAFEGTLRLTGATTSSLQRQIGEMLRPIVQRGGLLDQHPLATSASALPGGPARAAAPFGLRKSAVVLVATLALLMLPALLLIAILGGRELARRAIPASWKWSGVLATAISAAWLGVVLMDRFPRLAAIGSRASPVLERAAPVASGALWGAFVLAIGAWVFAPVHGLERIRHDALWPLLRSWMVLALLRTGGLVLLHAPVMALVVRSCDEMGLSARATWAWVPAAGLLTHFWLLSLVDNLSVYLDAKLVSGPPTARNPWHATIKRYFRGYVRRGVIGVDEKLLERTLFLPSAWFRPRSGKAGDVPSRTDVVCYGGGFARPRVAVGQKPLEAALGELPDEEEFPDRSANPEELPIGLLVPSPAPEVEPDRAEPWRHRLTLAPPRPRAPMPRLLGENATLLGWVLPQPSEKGIPLISDTEEDFGVVKRLLSEHYGAFEALHGDEVDDTDPTQKDFLFGALLHEMGVVARHDVLFATIGLFVEVASARSGWLSPLVRLPVTLYEQLVAGAAVKVADAYAALNGALHPLIQYLCFLRGVDERLLTARADVPRLMQTSAVMIAQLDRKPAAERSLLRTTPRDRAAWLARLFYEPLGPPGFPWARALGGAVFAAALATVVVRQVSDAIAYHPTYVARMKSLNTPVTEGETR
jgi:hypothetical protein